MEKFILLFRGSDVYQPNQSPEALQTLTTKMIAWLEELVKNGRHISSVRLHRAGKQVHGMKKAVTDIPFGEAKAIIGGCTIVQANDFNEAVEIAKACPILETNANIELRLI